METLHKLVRRSGLLIAALVLGLQAALPLSASASGNAEVCPDGTDGWTKIDTGYGNVSGSWGSVTWGNATGTATGSYLGYVVQPTYELDVCVKSGAQAFPNGDKTKTWSNLTGTSTLTDAIGQDISHLSYRYR